MNLKSQRNATLKIIPLIAVAAFAFGVRYYLDNREHFRVVQQPATFVVSNGIAYFTTPRGAFSRTNAKLVQLLATGIGAKAIVTFRDRYRGEKLVGASVTRVDVPHLVRE